MRHLPGANPNVNIGAVRKHRFSSAGCCSRIILDFGLSGGLGSDGHQHTTCGRLGINDFSSQMSISTDSFKRNARALLAKLPFVRRIGWDSDQVLPRLVDKLVTFVLSIFTF